MQNNNLPDGWKIVKLKDYITERKQKNKANEELTVFSISNKRGFVKSDDYFEGQVYSKDLKNYKIVKKGDFAYNPARINVGSIAYLESEEIGLLSPMYVIFSLNKEIDKDYFNYFIRGNLFNKQVNNFTQGAVRQILAFGDLGNISLLLPPLEVQKEIAGKISDLDRLIETQNNQIEKYEKLKKAMMKKLFSEGIGHTEFKDSKLGKIPKDWDVKNLNGFLELMTDYTANGSFASLKDNTQVYDLPEYAYYVRLFDIRLGIGHENQKYVDFKTYTFLKKSSLYGGEVLIANIGANVGEVFYFENTGYPATLAPNMILLKSNNNNSKFLYYYLSSHLGITEINKVISGSGQPKLNKTDLKTVNIPIPKLEEQKKISDILENIDNLLEKEREIKECYEKVKKGIVSLVFSCNLLIK